MPPFVASLLCCAFIGVLLRGLGKGRAPVSSSLWVPTIWVALIASKPAAAWIYGKSTDLGLGSDSPAESIDRNILIIQIIIGLIILSRRQINWAQFLADNRWMIAFQGFMFLSVWWSDDPFVAFKRWVRVTGGIIMILCLLTENDPVEGIRRVFVRCACILIPLSVLVMKYYPETGVYYNYWNGAAAYCGETVDKNALGRLAWVSGLFLVWSLDDLSIKGWFAKAWRRWPELIVLALCGWVLSKAQSATSLACFFVVVCIYFGARGRWARSNPKLVSTCAVAFIIASLTFLAVPDLRKIVTDRLGRRSDLTERTEVWDRALKLDTNMLIGEGYASFWLTRAGRALGSDLEVNEAHNGYLETYLNTGLVGLGFVAIMLYFAGRNTLRHLVGNTPVASLYAALFLGSILYNYTEAAINDSSLVGFIIFQLSIWLPFRRAPIAPFVEDPAMYAGPADSEPCYEPARLTGPDPA
ncbi:MAG TPA: O-antigen ligase family protein [Candidatus Didemnitutus sp.]|nr:O-antigen ligase family protein [Candidatus Didemnitutus sp.]